MDKNFNNQRISFGVSADMERLLAAAQAKFLLDGEAATKEELTPNGTILLLAGKPEVYHAAWRRAVSQIARRLSAWEARELDADEEVGKDGWNESRVLTVVGARVELQPLAEDLLDAYIMCGWGFDVDVADLENRLREAFC